MQHNKTKIEIIQHTKKKKNDNENQHNGWQKHFEFPLDVKIVFSTNNGRRIRSCMYFIYQKRSQRILLTFKMMPKRIGIHRPGI